MVAGKTGVNILKKEFIDATKLEIMASYNDTTLHCN